MLKRIAIFLKNSVVNPVFYIALIVLALIYTLDQLSFHTGIRIQDTTIRYTSPAGQAVETPVSLPYSEASTAVREYVFSGKIIHHFYNNTRVVIIPDDRIAFLTINGISVNLDQIDPAKLGDWNNGFEIDLANYLQDGENNFELKITDTFGRYGLRILDNPTFILNYTILPFIFLLGVMLVLLLYFMLKAVGMRMQFIMIFLAGLATHLVVLSYVGYDRLTYDILEGNTGHINYVEYIAKNFSLPSPNGWSFYHPPLYYISGAIIYKAAEISGMHYKYKLLQGLSLLYYVGFWFFGFLILKRFIKKPFALGLALAVLVFWPSGYIHALRIGNDVAFYFFYTVALYFINEWFLDKLDKDLYLGALFTALTVLVKTNGIILAGILGILLLLRLLRETGKLAVVRKGVLVILIIFSGYMLGSIDNYKVAIEEHQKDWALAGLIHISSADPALYCVNQPVNYVYFDVFSFLGQPYISTRLDSTGRQYFWNFLSKTSLFGEFTFPLLYNKILAIVISLLFLILTLYFLFGLLTWSYERLSAGKTVRCHLPSIGRGDSRNSEATLKPSQRLFNIAPGVKLAMLANSFERLKIARESLSSYGVLLLNLALLLLGLLLLRLKTSMPCLGDFRYVLPIVITFILFFHYAIEKTRQRGWKVLTTAGIVSGILFVISSALFYG